MKTRIFSLVAAVAFGLQLSANELWPIILDGTTNDKVTDAIMGDFRPDDASNFLYIWEGTYSAGDNSGLNFYGNTEGYLALNVGGAGWSGGGFCLTASGSAWQEAEALRQKIVANPDNYFFHLAIKSTDNYSHCFYLMGTESTKFVLGDHSEYDGPVYDNFERDGEWHDFFIPMSRFASALASTTVQAGVNVFVLLSQGIAGAQLNLDAVYFCDKEFMENEYQLHSGGEPVIPAENRVTVVRYLNNEGESVREESFTFHCPSLPIIEGFEFMGWQIKEGMLNGVIELQALYVPIIQGMPEVVVNPANPSQKLIRNGKVYILRDDKVYTLQGQQIQ